MKYFFYITLIFLLFSNCSSQKKINPEVSQRTKKLIEQKRFIINCNMAYPTPTMALQSVANAGLIAPGSTVSQINIRGSQNTFKIKGDSIKVYLPYYGEQRMAGMGYGRANTGIQYEGIPEASDFSSKDKKGNTVLKFTFKNDAEQCQAQVKIFPSGKSDISINSSHRTSIRYSGNINTIAAK